MLMAGTRRNSRYSLPNSFCCTIRSASSYKSINSAFPGSFIVWRLQNTVLDIFMDAIQIPRAITGFEVGLGDARARGIERQIPVLTVTIGDGEEIA